ncbi:MAG TPA: Flp family type IVb pilin [Xanthobacteraceae bacterium]|jgi:Flp pilus assembly pilin Flp|nr:Flp family type IVb pilin [Xanthobacteraceae bacterium]
MSQWPDALTLLAEFWRNEEGTTAIEIGLVAVGIAVAIVATVAALGAGADTSPAPVVK